MNIIQGNRPVLIFGAGIHLANAEKEALQLVENLGIPVCLTWGAADLLPESSPYRIGTFGTHGNRAANFAVQNADFLLCIGTRLDTKATGTPAKWFAREAKIVMVDIDLAEIEKMEKIGVPVGGYCMDAKEFIKTRMDGQIINQEWEKWLNKCRDWKKRYPAVLKEYKNESTINPYVFIQDLSRMCKKDDIIVSDTGCTLGWCMQAWEFKEGQRFLHPMNQTPMGYGLPGALGAYYATGKRIILVSGDGSFMFCMGELAEIGKMRLPIKIFIIENGGHGMCRATQREWMDGVYHSTSCKTGLYYPDFGAIADACEIESYNLICKEHSHSALKCALNGYYPVVTTVCIDYDHDLKPKVKYGHPNEDAYPYLDKKVLEKEMLVPLVETL